MHESLFYQLPICNLFTQHVIYLLWRDTTSELWTPVLFSLLIKQPQAILFIYCIYFSANSFNSIRLILCFSKTGEIDNLTESLGQRILVVLCVRQQHLQKRLPSPTGRLNLGFLLRENLPLCSTHLPLGVPNGPLLREHQWWRE